MAIVFLLQDQKEDSPWSVTSGTFMHIYTYHFPIAQWMHPYLIHDELCKVLIDHCRKGIELRRYISLEH